MVTRVSNFMLANRMLRNIQNDLAELSATQEKFSTGRNFSSPTDDPLGFMKALNLRDVLTTQRQHITNIDTAISSLEYSEAILTSVNSVISRSQELAMRASNTALSEATSGSFSEEVSQLFNQAFSQANTIYNENYLFSGHKVDTIPFVRETGADGQTYVVYKGDVGQRLIEVDNGIRVANNANGLETFFGEIGQVRSSVGVSDSLAALSTVLTAPPPSGGDYTGTFTVNDKTITVEATDTLETLRDKINDADADVVASIDSQNRLIIQSYRSIQVDLEQGTSNVLQALGLQQEVVGGEIGAGIDGTTTLASLGITTPEALRIELDGVQSDIDLSAAATVDDVLTSINSAGIEVDAFVNEAGTGITISARSSSADLEVSDARRVFGTAIGAGVTDTTTLASLGITPDGSIEIEDGTDLYTVDLTSAITVGDVLDAINSETGTKLTASINDAGTGIDLVSSFQTDSLEVREVGAGTTATQLGILDLQDQTTATDLGIAAESTLDETEPENLFQTLLDLQDLIRNKASGDEIMAKHSELSSELDSLLAVRSRGGARVNGMLELKNSFEDKELYITGLLSDNEDADLTEVIVLLQTRQLSLQGALQSGAQLLQTSLLNFLS